MAQRGEAREQRSLKELRVRRGQLKSMITRFADFIEKIADAADLKAKEIPARKLKVEQAFAELEGLQVEIEVLSEEEDPEEQLAERAQVEDKYYAAIAKAASWLQASESPAHSASFASGRSDPELSPSESEFRGFPRRAAVNVRLPQLTIPEFAGAYEQWTAFYDSFRALIHNNEALNDVQRFHYLVSALKGDAAQAISSIEITSANYSLAWELLRKRFENKKAIIRNHTKNLFELANVVKESHLSLRQFLDNFLKNFRALRNLGEPVDEWSTILIYLLSSKLDISSKREWEGLTYNQTSPSIDTFISFLTNRCQLLEAWDTKAFHNHNPSRRSCDPKAQIHVSVTNDNSSKARASSECILCRSPSYPLFRCEEFLKLSIQARIRTVRKLKACINCLRKGHNAQDCCYGPCRNCEKKHNTLLHLGGTVHSRGATSASAPGVQPAAGSSGGDSAANALRQGGAVATHSINASFVLLSTARMFLSNGRKGTISCRALLDNGSQSCFITSDTCQKLNLNVTKTRLPVTGINGVLTNIKGRVRATVRSMTGQFQKQLEFLVLDKITEKIPQLRFEAELLCVPQGIQLADPNFNEPGTVDVLLGASIFFDLLLEGQIRAAREGPILQNSKMGWIVSGALKLPNAATRVCHVAQSGEVTQNSDIERKIERFWAIEESERLPKSNFSKEEAEVEEHFCRTHSRMPTGRFIVRLPTRENLVRLGNNLHNATRRFYALERKLQGNAALRTSYTDFMREYIKLGHMSRIDAGAERGAGARYYLPHHAVVKATSITTKVRVVFDASCKSESGLSLNDVLKTGPCIQVDIFSALLRFRAHNVAFTADIAKMYRQFAVHDQDQALQRIVWRFDPLEPLGHYKLNTVTYGTAPASFLATRCLRQLAIENWAHCPDASAAIDREFYMDDWIGGASDSQSAIELIRKVSTILESAGLELRQWVSNDKTVLESAAAVAAKLEYSVKNDQGSSKTLGVIWNAPRDVLSFCAGPAICGRPTKRSILSAVAQIFDPLGLLGPVILTAKLIMQDLWKVKTGWDEPVEAGILAKWAKFSESLDTLKSVAVPRQFAVRGCSQVELHGFCDASQAGYGACIYARSVNQGTGEVTVRLVCSKSRVAPLKVVSLPRLELCGALLGAQLMQRTLASLNIPVNETVLWCDSTITLAWIAAESSRFKVFVANRVSQIQGLTRACQWRYVPGRVNPADVVSRGVIPHEIHHLGSWWRGPEFLAREPQYWPPPPGAVSEALPELRQASLLATTASEEVWLVSRYSSLRRLTRICAYLRRFVYNCRHPAERRLGGELSGTELDASTEAIVKLVQGQAYAAEIRAIEQTGSVSRSSRLSSLRPFLDNVQVLRVGGRLAKAKLSFSRKHPMILPARHPFTTLVIRQEHLRNLHAGAQNVLAAIRATFWPLNGKQAVKSVLRQCVTCFKAKPRYLTQCMGQLPADRVNAARPFLNCGIDYAGPYLVKARQFRNKTLTKAYICIFVCFATKAVHIELVSDLTSDGFLNALKRFAARRGICQRIYSDNATNFVGANRQLARFLELATEPDLRLYLSDHRIEWRFIPPRSPHFGGLWESAVRSAKYHLKRILSNVPLTFEGLYTCLSQVEAVLNSRPVCPLTEDPEELEPLTPGHFLIGSALTALPEGPAPEQGRGYRTHYEHLRLLVQHFWKQWSRCYLHTLQQCTKWHQSNVPEQLKNALAIIHEDGTPPMRWKMGRIIETHPGPDGRVRVVTLKTHDGVLKRAVARISLLPTEPC